MPPAFLPPAPLLSSASAKTLKALPAPSKRAPRAQVTPVSDRQLTQLASTGDPIVVKCFASYCPGCRGVAPKFRKIAAAYESDGSPIRFCELDYGRYEQFCKETMGVCNLPFFAIWHKGRLVAGEAMGWQSVSKKLVHAIDQALTLEKECVSAHRK